MRGAAFTVGFEARQTDKGERMVLDAARLSLPLLRAVQDFAGQEMRAEEANSPSVSPSVSAVVNSSAINSTNASVNTPTNTPVTPFDPTKSLVLKTVNLPEKTTLLESQVQALQERRNAFESEVPERCVVVFRAENGVNPRNFGDAMYANMARASDDAPEVDGVAGSSGEDAGDDHAGEGGAGAPSRRSRRRARPSARGRGASWRSCRGSACTGARPSACTCPTAPSCRRTSARGRRWRR